jgi:DNA polymerase I-like protein with 3'-5' exonuclease and polymerase domains
VSATNALFLGTAYDKQYLPYIKSMFGGLTTYVVTEPVTLLSHLEMYCAKRSITKIVSTNTTILSRLLHLQGNPKSEPKLSEYAGSLFEYKGLEIVFIDPLAQLVTVSYGKFVAERYISKVVAPQKWTDPTPFKWQVLTASNIDAAYADLSGAYAIAADIETSRVNLAIRCIGFAGVFVDAAGAIDIRCYVLPIDSEWALLWMRKINQLPAAKIFANGKYDNSYLLRYNAHPTNWLWDVQHMFHSWYSELPKDLAFLNAFFLRKVVYWKDLADTNDLEQYYRYNAMDCWATANVWIQQLVQAPDWAKRNYLLEFPLVYPCLLAEMTGIKRDAARHLESRAQVDKQEADMLARLRVMVGAPAFNPGSPKQVLQLFKILGCGDLTSSDAKNIAKAKYRHPLISRILEMIAVPKGNPTPSIRGLRKLKGTYLRLDSDADKYDPEQTYDDDTDDLKGGAKEYKGRILYSINPHGTDTGRCASKSHHFWCGFNIQNIPTGVEVKQTLCAEDGFYLGECDLEQAESRDTAHISGDTALIAAVTGTKDFHSVNCSAFFGVPYADIYDDATGKTKNKALRDLAKRVNHGANYNMGAGVLVDTMGFAKIYEAGKLLKLPYKEPKKIAEHLLAQFHRTYPRIAGAYYVAVVNEIGTSKRLVSRAFHHTRYNLAHYSATGYIDSGDWTRYCFGAPDKNKSDLNSYVAHCPQSLNARTLNEAFLKVFYEVALPNPKTFRLHAQIHDSILFSYATSWEVHAESVRNCMEIPVTVRDVSGTYRTFTVPAALKLGKKDKVTGEFKRAKYWDQTE